MLLPLAIVQAPSETVKVQVVVLVLRDTAFAPEDYRLPPEQLITPPETVHTSVSAGSMLSPE